MKSRFNIIIILMAAIFVVPMLIAAYSEDGNTLTVKVSDNSGIVMPYLESGGPLLFEDASGINIDTLKSEARSDEAVAVLIISQLDSNKNVSLSLYSGKQINADNQSRIHRLPPGQRRPAKFQLSGSRADPTGHSCPRYRKPP